MKENLKEVAECTERLQAGFFKIKRCSSIYDLN